MDIAPATAITQLLLTSLSLLTVWVGTLLRSIRSEGKGVIDRLDAIRKQVEELNTRLAVIEHDHEYLARRIDRLENGRGGKT